MILSILIPSTPNRETMLASLISNLDNQIDKLWLWDEVEILVEMDSYEKTIGEKRNALLDKVDSKYLCFIDSDDRVAENYLQQLMLGIMLDFDCCSLNGVITTNGSNPRTFIHSLKYNSWFEENNIYYRPPNHLNCIKSETAKQFKFPQTNTGEDKDWSMQIAESGLLKTEYEITETIYFYDYISNK